MSDLTFQSPFHTPITISSNVTPIERSKGVDEDFEFARKNLLQMMDVTRGAIQQMGIIAAQSQMPDAFDVLNKMMKTYNEQQAQLLQMYRIGRSDTSKPVGNQSPTEGGVVDNRVQNVFIGTPADLAKKLEMGQKIIE